MHETGLPYWEESISPYPANVSVTASLFCWAGTTPRPGGPLLPQFLAPEASLGVHYFPDGLIVGMAVQKDHVGAAIYVASQALAFMRILIMLSRIW